MGVARIFQRGGHTDSYIGYSPNCHLNIVGCLLTKRLTKGGSRAPQDPPPPWLRPCVVAGISVRFSKFAFVLFCYITNHLITGPLVNSEFCFPRISMFPEMKSRETKFTVPLGTSH